MNHLLSLATLNQEDFAHLIARACEIASGVSIETELLRQRCIGLEFRKTSTRTRTSFAVAAVRLGGQPIIYGPADLQINTGETARDTAKVLSNYLEMLVVRSAADPRDLHDMAQINAMPIINAMSADEHPSQALSDLAMLTRTFGSLRGLRMVYVGEGNNTAVALAYAVARTPGMHARFCTPRNYGLESGVLERAYALSDRFGGKVSESHDPPSAADAESADVVYTTRWQTTGTAKKDPNWRQDFLPFAVTQASMNLLARNRQAVFMHDLPAVRGEECDAETLDGARSIAHAQAQQKLFTAMSIIEWCFKNRSRAVE